MKHHVRLALSEDLGDVGDQSVKSTLSKETEASAVLVSKDKGIIAGIELAKLVFHAVDPEVVFEPLTRDGTSIEHGDKIFEVKGSARSILTAERPALNYLQRLSGVATKTSQFVSAIEGTKAKILDTRKTTPGMRLLEKWAVKMGGGENHRMGLYDMIMVKDNHVDYCGGVTEALDRVEAYKKETDTVVPVEIETRDMDEVRQALDHPVTDRIMLDNFSVEQTGEAVLLIDGKVEVESSGGIGMHNVRDYAECGVDFISIGALTHQISSLDLSLKAKIL